MVEPLLFAGITSEPGIYIICNHLDEILIGRYSIGRCSEAGSFDSSLSFLASLGVYGLLCLENYGEAVEKIDISNESMQ